MVLHLINKINFHKHIALLAALCLFAVTSRAQEKEKTPVYLEHSDSLEFDQSIHEDCQILKGNVAFRHETTFLYCDLAYFYEQSNKLDAYGNIRIVRGDSLTIYGDKLHYDGDLKKGKLRNNVKVINNTSTLTTDSLDYNQALNMGYYDTGGTIVDDSTTLVSKKGYFYFTEDYTLFKEDVVLERPNLVLKADTLRMDNKTNIIRFVGPTYIDYDKDTHIYTEKGWYSSDNGDSKLTKNGHVIQKGGKKLKGDTIYFNKSTGKAIALHNVRMTDTIQQMTICGEYGRFLQEDNFGLVTDSAFAIEHSGADSLFLHADTIRTITIGTGDSANQVVRALHNVRFFRRDIQGKCDSMIYHSADSVMDMYEDPVIWSDSTQLCGEFIQIFQKNKKVDYTYVQGWALAVIQVDSSRFNQVEGLELKAFMKKNQLDYVDVYGSALTVYYPKEEDGSIVGVNRAQSDTLTAFMKNKKFDKIKMRPNPKGTLYPENQIPEALKLVPRFVWFEAIRPKDKYDIFTRYSKESTGNKRKRIINKD